MSEWKIVRVRADLHARLQELSRVMAEFYAENPSHYGPEARETGLLALTDVIQELVRRDESHRRRAAKANRKRHVHRHALREAAHASHEGRSCQRN